MRELLHWLGVQLDDDERVVREATQGEWVWSREFVTPPGYHHRTVGPLEPGDAAFIAAHDPARVLREINAKRQTLGFLVEEMDRTDNPWWYDDKMERILKLLALPYADRPGYKAEEWAP